MKQKNKQEQHAANRQVELLTTALNGAAVSGGYWLNTSSRSLPRIYPKGPAVSPFNSLILSMHADQNGYKTNLYTLFRDAKKRGEAIREHETGAPFLWYRWKEYVNRHKPEESIFREDYLKLPDEEKALYKGIRNREVLTMFNIDQTTLPFIDKDSYEQSVERYGRYEDRKHNLDVGTVTNAGFILKHSFAFDHSFTLDTNLQGVHERLSEMPEYQREKADIGDVDNDGIMDEVAREEKRLVVEVEEEVYFRRGR